MSKDINHRECMLALAEALRLIAAGIEQNPEEPLGEKGGGTSLVIKSVRVPSVRVDGDVDYANVSCSYTVDDDMDSSNTSTVKHHTDDALGSSHLNPFITEVHDMLWGYLMGELPEQLAIAAGEQPLDEQWQSQFINPPATEDKS